MDSIHITDRVVYLGKEKELWDSVQARLIVTGIDGNMYAISDGKEVIWASRSDLRKFTLADSETYRAFADYISGAYRDHKKLYVMHKHTKGPSSDAYGSLAANSLTTLYVVKNLFERFKNEFR